MRHAIGEIAIAAQPRISETRASARSYRFTDSTSRRKRGDDGPGVIRQFWLAILAFFSWRNPVTWLLACICFVILAGVVIVSGFAERTGTAMRHTGNQIMTDAGFGIGSVRISGNHRTDPVDILTALGFSPGESIFAVDVHAARRHLLSLEWVSDAEVRRQYPDLITISIVEKLPFALWETSNGTYVVERSGRSIGLFDPHAFPRLPRLVGDGPRNRPPNSLMPFPRIGRRQPGLWDMRKSPTADGICCFPTMSS